MARISIIIPVFNRQQPAERAVRSALEQNFPDAEIVIVDDGSRPPFALPPALARANVRVVSQANGGAAAARNAGIAAARGEWIALLDSDDYWVPGTLAPRFALAERDFAADPNTLVAHVAGFVLYNVRSGRRETRIPRASGNPLDFASGCWFSPGSTLLIRKDVFRKIGPFDPQLRRLEDLDWFLRFARGGGGARAFAQSRGDDRAGCETGNRGSRKRGAPPARQICRVRQPRPFAADLRASADGLSEPRARFGLCRAPTMATHALVLGAVAGARATNEPPSPTVLGRGLGGTGAFALRLTQTAAPLHGRNGP